MSKSRLHMKNTILKVFLAVFTCISLFSSNVEASHLRGGEITWKCVTSGGKSKYKFKVVVYRNCQGCEGCLGDFETIVVCSMNGGLQLSLNNSFLPGSGTERYVVTNGNTTGNLYDIRVKRIDRKDVSPSCSFPAIDPLVCRQPSNNSDVGALEKHTYESGPIDFTGVLPPTDPNSPLVFSFENNARDGALNLQSAVGNGSMVLVAKMYPFYPNGSTAPQAVSSCFDSAPDFTESPAAILYTSGLDFVFNNNANDQDLDNLYYELGTPYANKDPEGCPYNLDPVDVWFNYPYYSVANPFGLPSDKYSFNNYTGEFTFKPAVAGDFVSVIKVSSYKCDQKVSEIYRDFKVKILVPDINQNTNRYPSYVQPFRDNANKPVNEINVVAGNTILIPLIIRDSLPGSGNGISPQQVEFTVNGIAMGLENSDTLVGCPYPPCAMLTKNKKNYIYGPFNPKPIAIQNTPGEIFGYGYDLGSAYGTGASANDTIWIYWPTSCSNLNKKDNCNGLTSSRYNFVVSAKDNFCRVPGKTIRTFSVNILPPDFYLSPPVRCITFNESNKQIELSWGVSTGDTNTFVRYEIYRNNTLIHQTSQIHTYNYIDATAGASPDSTYYVRAVNLCGVLDEVSPVKAMKLDAFFYRNNQARLTWNAIRSPKLPSSKGYVVYRSQSENPFNWQKIVDGDGDTTNTAAIDNYGLCGDTTYYKIESYDTIGCTSISTYDTLFHARIFASFHSDTVCFGTPTTFILTDLVGGIPPYSTVRWVGQEGFGAGNQDTVLFTYPSPGKKTYTFTVIDSKGCRIDVTDSTLVREVPNFEVFSDSACPNSVINLGVDLKSSIPIDSIYWLGDYDAVKDTFYFQKSGPYFDPSYSNPQWIFYSTAGTGNFPVYVTLKDIYGCTTTVIDTVKIGEPSVQFLSDPSLCYNPKTDSLRILPRYLTKPFNTVQWIDKANGQVIYQKNDGKDAFPLSVIAGRRYIDLEVRIEDSKGCKGEVSQIYTIAPWLDFRPDSLCIGDVANLRIVHKPISDTASYQYLWELDANTVDTVREPHHIYSSNGPKIITLLVTDIVTGCTTFIKDTLTVRDPMSFHIDVAPNCAGEQTVFTRVLDKATIDTAWEWTIDEFPNVIPNNEITFKGNAVCSVLLPSSDGYYRVVARINDQVTGCWTTVDTVLKVFNQPDIDFDVDSLNCAGKITQFISKVVGDTPPYIYSWSGEDNFVDTAQNPLHTYPENGNDYYSVSLSVTNSFGCVVTKTKLVRVCDDKRTMVMVPQIFSPGRERNNTLSVHYTNVDNFEFSVYNRWGIEVFKTTDPDFVWDGKDTRSTEYLMSGTYVYIVKANGLGKRNYLNKGTIAILR